MLHSTRKFTRNSYVYNKVPSGLFEFNFIEKLINDIIKYNYYSDVFITGYMNSSFILGKFYLD